MSHAIRFTVVAHASPRWRAAGGVKDADKRNQDLSEQRERNVRLVVEGIIRKTLGPTVVIQGGVSHGGGKPPKGVEVGGYAVGSRDSLKATKGDRQNNDEAYRRVDVIFERFITTTHTGMQSTGQISARIRKWWLVRVERLHVNYVHDAHGEVDLTLINGTSGKSMQAKAILKGSGYFVGITPSLNPAKIALSLFRSSMRTRVDDYKEKKTTEHAFGCDREMGFADFNGQIVTFEKRTYSLGLKGHTMSMSFNNLGKEASAIVLSPLGGFGPIGTGHYEVSGPLLMIGKNPGDWIDLEEMAANDATRRDEFTLTLTFPTETSRYEDISFTDRLKFEAFVEGHAERFWKQVTNAKP